MNNFLTVLLRLKEQLGIQSDKEVAEFLGLSDKAFNARKRRGKFPEDKLWLLNSLRPELKLDVGYILEGVAGSTADLMFKNMKKNIDTQLAKLEEDSSIIKAARDEARLESTKQTGGVYELERLVGMYSLLSPEAQQAAFAMVQHLRWQEFERHTKK